MRRDRRHEIEKRIADLKREGYDLAAIETDRTKAMNKLRADLDAINQKLVAQKMDPLISSETSAVCSTPISNPR
ncbi:MAG: hypothetical protein K0R17_2719 [Rariglobus sp.]|jgi:hypothetical protein|nr:hypothetical protein [Rariglobus sp.]